MTARTGRWLARIALAGAIGIGLALVSCDVVLIRKAFARDSGQWGSSSGAVREWYAHLMQPDHPAVSCCGEADAYWADEFAIDGDRYVAVITDDREDGPLGRPHIAVGTRFIVPNNKLKYDNGNPTGHGVIFIHLGDVLCFVVPAGI